MFKVSFFIVLITLSLSSFAGPREQAYRLHNRLVGLPPTNAVLDQMQFFIQNNDPMSAANLAMNNPGFYNYVLKNWFKAWSNEDNENRTPLNDFVATAIGMVRDGVPFNQALFGDILYIGDPAIQNVAPYAVNSNEHYEDLEKNRENLMTALVQRQQSSLNGITDNAGIFTTRAAGQSFFSAGTNRAVTRFMFINFLCKDYEALHDITRPDVYVRRDVDRQPGGDSRVFRNKCVGCHAGQDALGGAWAYFDFVDGELVHTPGTVVDKMNANNLFNDGHVVTNSNWVNMWADGQNASLGWTGVQQGNGASQLGQLLGRSKQFSTCMAERSFKLVCLKEPKAQADKDAVANLANNFELNGTYNLKDLIARSSALCLGE